MSDKKNALTVYDATYNLLRKLRLTTIVGKPGSTEQPFLKNFAPDFEYILGLQEVSAVATARACGCFGVAANTTEEIKAAFRTALSADGSTAIAIHIAHQLRPLVPDVD